MRILVLNGSPAGKDSITLQTVEFLKACFPEQEYETIHAARYIRSFEKDFSSAEASLKAADLILFCYPVYTFLVPAQLHRFVELIRENGVDLSGKYASQITTSKHFYDATAHRFIADQCADLNLRYIRGLSADMEDLLTAKGQKEARSYFRFLLWNIKKGFFEKPSADRQPDSFKPVIASEGRTARRKDQMEEQVKDNKQKPRQRQLHAALVTDYDPADPPEGLMAMIARFKGRFPGDIEQINLREFPFQGGCLGCFHCAQDGTCIYKDGFDAYLREHINGADAVVYAYTIKDHSMGYRFKLYDDRQFCNGHRTVTMGKPVGYLVDGMLSGEENLRVVMEARAQVGGNYLAGIASDESDPDRETDQMADTLAWAMRHHYTQPKNFYGVGGLKIFRDLIYEMQGLMKEDHRFYKEHGFYDFPQKKKGRIMGMYLVSALMNNKIIQKKSKVSMTEGMLMPYRSVLKKAQKDTNQTDYFENA